VPFIPDLASLVTAGYSVEDDGITYVVEPFDLGQVVLPTGEIVGCDPLVAHSIPFVDTVPPGRYTLRAWVAVLYRGGAEWQRRIAGLQLVIVDQPVTRWTMALLPDQDAALLDEETFFGYGVDSGTGTLADRIAVAAIEDWDFDRIEDAFIPAHVPIDPIEAVCSAVVDEQTGANAYVVGSGRGDGAYPTYVGWTADGTNATFVTHFGVLPAIGL
jgi:hypothetical protein